MNIKSLKFTDINPEYFWKDFGDKQVSVITAHAEMIYMASKNTKYLNPIKDADILVADGVGLRKGLQLLGINVAKCSGVDLVESLIRSKKEIPTFLWGGSSEVAEMAKKNYSARGLNVVGIHDGYDKSDKKIFEEIKSSKSRLVLVGMGGTERQLDLVNRIKQELDITAITVGGAFDVAAGRFKRAPKVFQLTGLEWLWRMVQDPKRLERLPHLFGFVFLVLREKFTNEK